MFQRTTFKLQARQNLANQYSKIFLVTLFILLVHGLLAVADYFAGTSNLYYPIWLTQLLLIGGPIFLATATFFLFTAHNGQADSNQFFLGLLPWGKAILAALLRAIMLLPWFILFIIPGIIKLYAYSQYFFILADHPQADLHQALKTSERMTKSYKMELFMLDLSYLGWFLLGVITCGLAFFYILPYYWLTRSHVYCYLKAQALENHICTPEELGMTAAPAAEPQSYPEQKDSTEEQPQPVHFTAKADASEKPAVAKKPVEAASFSSALLPDNLPPLVPPAGKTERKINGATEQGTQQPAFQKEDIQKLLNQISLENPSLKDKIDAAVAQVEGGKPDNVQTAPLTPPVLDTTGVPDDILGHMQALNQLADEKPPKREIIQPPGEPAYELYVFPAVEAMQKEKARQAELAKQGKQSGQGTAPNKGLSAPVLGSTQAKPVTREAKPADDDADDFAAASFDYIEDPTKQS